MNRFLVIQNFSTGDGGAVTEALERQGVSCTIVKSYETESLPSPRGFDGVLVLGSPASCLDLTQYPALERVRELTAECVAEGKPVLGICFGAQLLAQVLGAKVRRLEAPEYGGYQVRLSAEGRRSPLFAGFPESFAAVQWHEDTFDIPPGAVALASSAACPNQAFAAGQHVGLQFHLEVTGRHAVRWVEARPESLQRIGKTPRLALSELHEAVCQQAPLCDSFIRNFLAAAR